ICVFRSCSLCPYTTLFRSDGARGVGPGDRDGRLARGAEAKVQHPLALAAVVAVAGEDLLRLRHLAVVDDHERADRVPVAARAARSEEHTSELQSRENLVCR